MAQVGLVISDIKRLPGEFESELPQAYRDATDIVAQVEARLFDRLIVEALDSIFPTARRVLWVLGILLPDSAWCHWHGRHMAQVCAALRKPTGPRALPC